MKIQCNVCEAAEAKLLCCADEAALCGACDQKVHAANKLASKHQRVPLSTYSSHMPKCDICQETVGHFFCLQDRSLLCRRCDVAIHTANSLVSAHDRFLLTGVTVGLEATESGPSSATGKANVQKKSGPDPRPVPKRTTQVSTDESRKNLHVQGGDFSSSELFLDGGSNTGGSIPQLQLDEFFELGDYNQNYDYMASSKDIFCGKFGVPDCSNIVEGDDCLGLGPDAFWTVPEIPSPPAASGLPWPKMTQTPSNSAVFVPDILSLPAQDFQYGENPKRRRRF